MQQKKKVQRLFTGVVGSELSRGRPPIGDKPMTCAERKQRSRVKRDAVPTPCISTAVIERWHEALGNLGDYRKACSYLPKIAIVRYAQRLEKKLCGLPEWEQIGILNRFILSLAEHREFVIWRHDNFDEAYVERHGAPPQKYTLAELLVYLENKISRYRTDALLDLRRMLGVKVTAEKTGEVQSSNIEKTDAKQNQKNEGNALMRRTQVHKFKYEDFDDVESFQPTTSSPLGVYSSKDPECDLEGVVTDERSNPHTDEQTEIAERTNPSRNTSEKYAKKHSGEAILDQYEDFWLWQNEEPYCVICAERILPGKRYRDLHMDDHSARDITLYRKWARTNVTNLETCEARWRHVQTKRADREQEEIVKARPLNEYGAAFFRNNQIANKLLRDFCIKHKVF